MEALGNNFIIVDSVTQDFSFSKNSISEFFDKEDFLDFDQVLVIEPPEKEIADFSVKIFNQDCKASIFLARNRLLEVHLKKVF